MKKTLTLLVAVLLTATTWAQTPQSFKYQAVARDASGEVVANQAVGIQISILQGSISGTAVYAETFTPTTNEFGLINLSIGAGTVVTGDLATIDWSADTYFIIIEMDITGGTTYEEYGTSQLLSVPYALHAKTAKNLTGTVTETDPLFTAWDKTTGISITESQISDLNHFTNTDETDQIFTASVAKNITASDTTRWGSTAGTEVDPLFTAWDKEYADLINTPTLSTANWNTAYGWGDHSTAGYLTGYTETDPVFTSSQANNITATDITNLGNLSGTNTGDQDISGIATNATAITTLQTEQTTQNTEIEANTAKTGITTAQANEIAANTLKVGYTDALV